MCLLFHHCPEAPDVCLDSTHMVKCEVANELCSQRNVCIDMAEAKNKRRIKSIDIQKLIDLIVMLNLPIIIVMAWLYYPYCLSGPTLCIWKNCFGFDCPGCGLVRAFCYLVHGNFRAAVAMNWLIIPVLMVCSALSVNAGRRLRAGHNRMKQT
jgi:hypothetical protein